MGVRTGPARRPEYPNTEYPHPHTHTPIHPHTHTPTHPHSPMAANYTTDQILALAPDSASAAAGRGLATRRKWVSAGRGERALWGECQGSGAKPYQAKVDLEGPAFHCS